MAVYGTSVGAWPHDGHAVVGDDLAPGNLGAVDGDEGHQGDIRVGQDLRDISANNNIPATAEPVNDSETPSRVVY